MSYSHKQKLYAEFILKKIGMGDSADVELYLSHLEKLYGRRERYPPSKYHGGIRWRYTVSDCIDILKQDLDIRKALGSIKSVETKSSFSATDLANYHYCSASFVISNSFLIENPSGEEFTKTGKQLHEQLLGARTKWYKNDSSDFLSSDTYIAILRKSRLVFNGHQDPNKIFENEDWVGVPDYIFQDAENKYFVVEEKFHKKRNTNKKSLTQKIDATSTGFRRQGDADKVTLDGRINMSYFFSNHIVQLASYIKNIREYPISYGYLLYWYYDLNSDDQPYIHKLVAKKIILNTGIEELYSKAMRGIKELKSVKNSSFAIEKLNMRKCAGCVVNKYCGHKTRRFNNLSFPYSPNFLTLYSATYPDELENFRPCF